jgi:hypothetical protein
VYISYHHICYRYDIHGLDTVDLSKHIIMPADSPSAIFKLVVVVDSRGSLLEIHNATPSFEVDS